MCEIIKLKKAFKTFFVNIFNKLSRFSIGAKGNRKNKKTKMII